MKANVTLSTRSLRITQHLCLNEHEVLINSMLPVTKRSPVDHVFCCDISGSMWDDLPLMRRQLKNRISDIVKDEDTITIIAFAGSNECFVLKEFVKCSSPKDLQLLQGAIDKYLVPMGCTDFVNPINKTEELIKKGHNGLNWIFLSDGGHNESSFQNVIDALANIKDGVAGATIIEYGYYADSKRLSQMADLLSGSKVVAEDFENYEPKFESAISGATGKPMIEIDVPNDITDNPSPSIPKMFYINQNTKLINTVCLGNTISLPEGVNKFYSFTSKDISNAKDASKAWDEACYAATYILADMLQYAWAEKVLALTGDMKFIEMYANSFGKQKLFAFQNEILAAVFDKDARGEIDTKYKPSPANYCIIDFFNDLQSDDKNQILVVDPSFSYKRIGSATVAKSEGLSAEDQAKLASAKSTAEVKKLMEEKDATKVEVEKINKGYPINGFTWNETRANFNARIKIDVKLKLPKNNFGVDSMDSTIFRNFNIVKDGIVNTNIIPLILTKDSYKKISAHKAVVFVPVDESKETVKVPKDFVRCTVDISKLPVVNINRANGVKKATMTKMEYELLGYKFKLKYLGWLKKNLGSAVPSKNKWPETEETKWLESLGITSEGFNPPTQLEKNENDFYMSINFTSKFASFSSIPSIEAVNKKLAENKKLTSSETFMKKTMDAIDAEINKAGDKTDATVKLFDKLTAEKRELGTKIAQTKFAMIVARRWFNDCDSFDQNTDSIKCPYLENDMNVTYGFNEEKEYL